MLHCIVDSAERWRFVRHRASDAGEAIPATRHIFFLGVHPEIHRRKITGFGLPGFPAINLSTSAADRTLVPARAELKVDGAQADAQAGVHDHAEPERPQVPEEGEHGAVQQHPELRPPAHVVLNACMYRALLRMASLHTRLHGRLQVQLYVGAGAAVAQHRCAEVGAAVHSECAHGMRALAAAWLLHALHALHRSSQAGMRGQARHVLRAEVRCCRRAGGCPAQLVLNHVS